MQPIDAAQIHQILQNLSNLELSFMEYSDHSKNFVEYSTYLAYMDNLAIRKHNLWKFYFKNPLNSNGESHSAQIPNVIFDTQKIPDITPFSVCKLFNFPDGPLHQCDYYTMLYNYEGMAKVTIGKEKTSLCPGDIIIIPPMVPYALDVEIESICLAFDIKKSFINANYNTLFLNNPMLINFVADRTSSKIENSGFVFIHTDNTAQIKDLSLQIFTEYINQEAYYTSAMKNLLALFFTYILRCNTTKIQSSLSTTKTQQNFKTIMDYISNNYQYTNLEDTAKHVHFSKQYVCRIIKETIGDTFSNVLLAERLNVACNLLITSNTSLEEISNMCGFSTAAYFSRIFKQVYGKTPSAYRKEERKR